MSLSEDTYPFSTLAVWRNKLTEDIAGDGVGEPAEDYRLRLLLEQACQVGVASAVGPPSSQCSCFHMPLPAVSCCPPCFLTQGKDVEQAVLGCLKDALFDLHEGVVWRLLAPAFEEQQRQVGGAGRCACVHDGTEIPRCQECNCAVVPWCEAQRPAKHARWVTPSARRAIAALASRLHTVVGSFVLRHGGGGGHLVCWRICPRTKGLGVCRRWQAPSPPAPPLRSCW